MKRRPRKFLRTLIVFLILGAIVNVAVAWGCAFFFRPFSHSFGVAGIVDAGTGGYGSELSVGFPVLALRGLEWTVLPNRADSLDGTWIVTGIHARFGDGKLRLPYRPLWPGFAINTVFYAGVLWVTYAATAQTRRWRRLKRGLCPACAYPVGTSSVCTECGATVILRSDKT